MEKMNLFETYDFNKIQQSINSPKKILMPYLNEFEKVSLGQGKIIVCSFTKNNLTELTFILKCVDSDSKLELFRLCYTLYERPDLIQFHDLITKRNWNHTRLDKLLIEVKDFFNNEKVRMAIEQFLLIHSK
jgi:hypothetical protein